MANPEHLSKLEEGIEAWNQWRKKHPTVDLDFIGAGLRNADLRNVHLRDAHLRDANLSGVNLRYANLVSSQFSGEG